MFSTMMDTEKYRGPDNRNKEDVQIELCSLVVVPLY